MNTRTVIFDLGGVLIDHNPRYLFRKIFETEEEVSHFLESVCTSDWNLQQDAGRTIAEANAERIALFPEHEDNIRAYYDRWPEMLGGEIAGSVEILRELAGRNTPLFALTNWSAETFLITRELFGFLQLFDGIVLSGEERLIKPDPEIYQVLLSRHGIDPQSAVFIDDKGYNTAAAEAFGITGLVFTEPEKLRSDLTALGCL